MPRVEAILQSTIPGVALRGVPMSARIQYSILKGSSAVLRGVGYRGLRRVCRFITPLFPRENSAIIEVEGRRLRVYLNDDYWVKYALFGFNYEMEIASVLHELLDCRAVFLDCGANIGYWSVYAGKKIGSRDRVIAVEPTESTFARLVDNSELNGNSFLTMRNAVYSRSGETLQFLVDPARHDSNRIVSECLADEHGSRSESVSSITIDDVFENVLIPDDRISNIVVKLDVEGAEREAFQGAQDLIARGAIFIYEDHGSDPKCKNTEFVLECHLETYFLRPGMQPIRIRDLEQLAGLKTCLTKGYNLIAARKDSTAMMQVLAGLVRKNPEIGSDLVN